MLLFVGRIQPLKGLDVAIGRWPSCGDPDAVLVVVGGPSGADGGDEARAQSSSRSPSSASRTASASSPPQPHHLLSTYYRAADVCLVPSRSESFGLVALEAAACGTPVVAAAVGGLRTLVDHGRTGFLVEGRDPEVVRVVHRAAPRRPDALAADMGVAAAELAPAATRGRPPAARLRRLYADLTVGALVELRADVVDRCRRTDAELDALEALIDAWLRRAARREPDRRRRRPRRAAGERRWYVRLRGEEKDVHVWFTLGQRTLHYETYVMPAPEENHASSTSTCCGATSKLYGAPFGIGEEDAVFLVGQLPTGSLDEDELDRILGSLYAYVEQFFRPALRIGFASRFSA